MTWFFGVFTAVLLLDALRARARLSSLPTLTASDRLDEADRVVAITGADVELDRATAAAAAAHLDRAGLDAVDLVPARGRVADVLGFTALVDPGTYRSSALARGRSAGAALIVRPELAERAGLSADRFATSDGLAIHAASARAKLYAPRAADFALAPGLAGPTTTPAEQLAVAQQVFGGLAPIVLGVQLLMFVALAAGAVRPGAWPAGLLALAAFHLQPLIATAGTSVRPPDLWVTTALRLPIELIRLLRMATAPRQRTTDAVESRRDEYAALLSRDPQSWFEPRRVDCPLCGSEDLSVELQTRDLMQHKPGTFTVEACEQCGHLFQNPRLSIEGLDFYYKDFYDGLGEERLDYLFGMQSATYRRRAAMVAEEDATPRRWLDVGGGHGHFCLVARGEFPDTHFDALDLADSVDEAARRGWVDSGHRALFPDVAPTMGGRYDVVSMHHYLEHTREPREEIAAAHHALRGDGLLLIELPDPESPMARALGRYWIPWLQPQHLHFLSVANLCTLLREQGFEPIATHRGEAHQKNDLFCATFLWLSNVAPLGDVPWRPRMSAARRALHRVVWTLGLPLLAASKLGDLALAPYLRRTEGTNAYRVLARKTGVTASGVIDAAA